MRISNQLIEKFFTGNCSANEKRVVMDYFKKNPEEFSAFISEQGWNDFQPGMQEIPSEKMLRHIEKRIWKTGVWYTKKTWLAAASVVFLAGLLSFFYWLLDPGQHTVQPTVPIVKNSAAAASETPLATVKNSTKKTLVYNLPDGSKVELALNSSIQFHSPFINNKRDIYLQGEALFTVAKDKKKPFIVHSQGITTTALGTVFSVSDNSREFTTVRLFRGKIVVKKDTGNGGKSFKDIYLMPGQKLLLDKATFLALVDNNAEEGRVYKKIVKPVRKESFTLSFDNQSLDEIFLQLKDKYKVSIVYDVDDMQQISFTGAHNSAKESLEDFLNTLCILNELSLLKSDDTTFTVKVK